MSYASISGSQTEQRKPKERREERRVIAGIRERENEAAARGEGRGGRPFGAEGRGARRPALRSAGRGSCRSGELGSGEADSCFVPASGALLPSVPSVSLLWLPSYGLHPKPSSLGGHHLAPKARNSGGHFLEAPMGDVASGARWTCSWGAGEAPVVISHLGPPPQSQGPPPGGGQEEGWMLGTASPRCQYVPRGSGHSCPPERLARRLGAGRWVAPAAAPVCLAPGRCVKRFRGKTFPMYTLPQFFLIGKKKKELKGRRALWVKGGLRRAGSQRPEARRGGSGDRASLCTAQGPGRVGQGPGGSEQATAEQVTSEQGRAQAAST